jgi:DNA-binding GntR family transcriptional regulator
VRQINKVRLALEKLSLREVPDLRGAESLRNSLQNIIEDMKTAARKEDRLALANLDADFHETLMKAANNPVLLKLWQMLRPQLVIIFGLATLRKSLKKVVDEHRTLLNGIGSLGPEKLGGLMEEHILADNLSIDFLSLESDQDAEKEAGRTRARRAPE